jgi:hypothetical protein
VPIGYNRGRSKGNGKDRMMNAHEAALLKQRIRRDAKMVDIVTEWACKGEATWDDVAHWEKALSDDIDTAVTISRAEAMESARRTLERAERERGEVADLEASRGLDAIAKARQ